MLIPFRVTVSHGRDAFKPVVVLATDKRRAIVIATADVRAAYMLPPQVALIGVVR